jgi:ABC-type transport system substrate-binding protein
MTKKRWFLLLFAFLVAVFVPLALFLYRGELNVQEQQPAAPLPNSPPLSVMYNAEEQPAEKSLVAQLLQAQLGKQGIEAKLDPVPNTLYNERLAKGDYEAVLTLWFLDYNDPEGFLTDFYSKAGYRAARYSNPEYDRLYLGGLKAPTEAEKLAKYREAVDLLQRDLPWVPLYSNTEIFLMKPGAAGFQSNTYQYFDYRQVRLEQIRTASDVELQTLDPAMAYDLTSKHLVTQSYEGLIALDKDSNIVPALATHWEFSPKGDALTFKLRQGVKFHAAPLFKETAGRDMTAEDVKASFERLVKSNSPYTYIFDYVAGIEAFKTGKSKEVSGFKVLDPQTFQITLTQPFPTMLPWLLAPASYVMPKELPDKYDFSRGSVGTGPFVLRAWDGVTARFDANKEYWQAGQPFAKTLSIRIIKDVNTLTSAFQRGEIDIMNTPVALYSNVFDNKGNLNKAWKHYTLREVPLSNLKFVAFNMEKSPWGTDPALRARVSAAIDREAMAQRLFKGKARIARSVIPSGVAGFKE